MSTPSTESFEEQLTAIIQFTNSRIATAVEAASKGAITGAAARTTIRKSWDIQAKAITELAEQTANKRVVEELRNASDKCGGLPGTCSCNYIDDRIAQLQSTPPRPKADAKEGM